MTEETARAVAGERTRIIKALTMLRHKLLGQSIAVAEGKGTGAALAYEDAAGEISRFVLNELVETEDEKAAEETPA